MGIGDRKAMRALKWIGVGALFAIAAQFFPHGDIRVALNICGIPFALIGLYTLSKPLTMGD